MNNLLIFIVAITVIVATAVIIFFYRRMKKSKKKINNIIWVCYLINLMLNYYRQQNDNTFSFPAPPIRRSLQRKLKYFEKEFKGIKSVKHYTNFDINNQSILMSIFATDLEIFLSIAKNEFYRMIIDYSIELFEMLLSNNLIQSIKKKDEKDYLKQTLENLCTVQFKTLDELSRIAGKNTVIDAVLSDEMDIPEKLKKINECL